MVEHLGTMRGGHYVGYVRCQQDEICEDIRKDGSRKNPWYYISNSHVKRVSLSEVLCSEAYLLFYEKCTLWWISRILKHCTMHFTILNWHRLCQFSITSFWHFNNGILELTMGSILLSLLLYGISNLKGRISFIAIRGGFFNQGYSLGLGCVF